MPSFFEPIIGSSFDAIAAQRMGYNQLDTSIQSANLARQAQAQQAVNSWLAQASQLRQGALDRDAAAQQRSDELAATERATLRDYAFRKGEQAASIAAEDRRTATMAKKADDQLQAQKDIIAANEKARTDAVTQNILDAGQTFAAQYAGTKRYFESSQAQYHALQAEQDKLEAENKALMQGAGKTIFGSPKRLSEDAQTTVTENSKRIKEIQRLLGPRGDVSKQYDASEKQHQKLLYAMEAAGFIPDDQSGAIFHGPTKQRFSFNTRTLGVDSAPAAPLMSPVMAGPNATLSALSNAPTSAPAAAAPATNRWTFDPASGTVKPNTAATVTAPPAAAPAPPASPSTAAPVQPAAQPVLPSGLTEGQWNRLARRLGGSSGRADDSQVRRFLRHQASLGQSPTDVYTNGAVASPISRTNAPVIAPPPAATQAPVPVPQPQTNAPVIAGPRSVISARQMAAAQKGIPAQTLEGRELSKLSSLPNEQLLAIARRFGMDLRYTGVDSFTTADASKIYGKDELVRAVERLAQQNDVAL